MAFFQAVFHDDHANKVDEIRFWITLNIKIHMHTAAGKFRLSKDVDFLVADRHGLKGVMAPVCRLRLPLSFAPRSECVGKLSDCENTFLAELLDLLLRHSAKQTEVVFLYRLVVAARTELTDLAMVFENQLRRRLGIERLLQAREKLLDIPSVGVQTDLCGLALSASPDDPIAWHDSLIPRKKQSTHLHHEPLFLADLMFSVEQNGNVMEIPEF